MHPLPLEKLIVVRRGGGELELGPSSEAMFLADGIDRYLAIQGLFDGYAEAPEVVMAAHQRHGGRIAQAADELGDATLRVLEEVHAEVFAREQRDTGADPMG